MNNKKKKRKWKRVKVRENKRTGSESRKREKSEQEKILVRYIRKHEEQNKTNRKRKINKERNWGMKVPRKRCRLK